MKNKFVNLIASVIIATPLFMIALNEIPKENTENDIQTVAWDPGQPGGG